MKIDMNQDFEKKFKHVLWKGFGTGEVISGVIALVVGISIGVGLHFWTKLSPAACVYGALPFAIPILFLGFFRHQGHSSFQLLKIMIHFLKTRQLGTSMEERAERNKVFTMKSHMVPRKKQRKRGKIYGSY